MSQSSNRPEKRRSSRREFVKLSASAAAAAVCAPTIISPAAAGSRNFVPPSDRIVMGCIGTGGMGLHDMRAFLRQDDVQVVAVCDVETRSNLYYGGTVAGREPAQKIVNDHYSNGKQSSTDCDAYIDFQELLARDDIDAVTVTTPDHWHGLISVAAAQAGKDIYCEKPLANSVGEGRAVADAVKANDRILQTGSHERSGDNARLVADLVQNGHIGKLTSVEINMPCDDPHHRQVRRCTGVPPSTPVPEGFDYDRWLGHTAVVDFTPTRCHFWWRFVLAYGGGEMTDRGAHVIDLAQMIAGKDETGPISIQAEGVQNDQSLYDAFFNYRFQFEYDDGLKMIGTSEGPRGLKLVGTDGWLFVHVHGGRLEAEPKSLLKIKLDDGAKTIGRSPGHHRNFVDCVKSREATVAPAEAGHRTASICHLANIAMKLKRPLAWDPQKETVIDDQEANKLLTPEMRVPWKL